MNLPDSHLDHERIPLQPGQKGHYVDDDGAEHVVHLVEYRGDAYFGDDLIAVVRLASGKNRRIPQERLQRLPHKKCAIILKGGPTEALRLAGRWLKAHPTWLLVSVAMMDSRRSWVMDLERRNNK